MVLIKPPLAFTKIHWWAWLLDSVVTLNLTVSNVLSSSFAKTICSGQSYFFNGIN
ncbi:MAG: hypothetical protein IPQ19_12465 [Bacteroidetes bacterium]|nr:hypothetical protein [Bacteroidota bacterium]